MPYTGIVEPTIMPLLCLAFAQSVCVGHPLGTILQCVLYDGEIHALMNGWDVCVV